MSTRTSSMVATRPSGRSLEVPRKGPKLLRSDASIILVGCKTAGKRTLGFIAAKHLGRRLLTEEQFFEQTTGYSRAAFLQQRGRQAFEKQMAIVLAGVLGTNRQNCVIECGMGILSPETEDVIRRIAETNPVIYIKRDRAEVQRLLGMPWPELDRMLAKDQAYRAMSNLEYFNLTDLGDDDRKAATAVRSGLMSSARLVKAREDFTKFLDFILGQGLTRSWNENPFSIGAVPLEYRERTFVLHLRLSCLLVFKHDLSTLEASAEAVELIIDAWPDNVLDIITEAVALIRRKIDVPIIFNVEENPQGQRRRTQDECDTVDLQLLLHGIRLGVEYISLDLNRNANIVSTVLSRRGRTRIIGNYVFRGFAVKAWDDQSFLDCYRQARELGCQIVRILRFYMGDLPTESHQRFLDTVHAYPDPKPPLVALNFSVFGANVPQLGVNLMPVTHELLQNAESEWLTGVSTSRAALRVAFRHGTLQPLHFYTLGSKVHYSASPSMHRAAFEHYMMPHTFDAKQCRTIDEVKQVLAENDFGGASVAPPFKLDIMPLIAHLSSHATAIGAVNLVLPLRGETSSILDHANARNKGGVTRSLYGDNTDWSAIVNCVRRAISPRNSIQRNKTTALIIGAGGMARAAIYALTKLGCRNIFIHNRTQERAETVARHFNKFAEQHNLNIRDGRHSPICHVIDSVKHKWPEGWQLPTIILSCIPADGADDAPTVDFRMPAEWLRSSTGGVVFELAYEPLVTPLVKQVRRMREEGNTLWVIVDGLEVVGEMAVEAFELMTGRKAPRNLMTRVCNDTWEKQFAPFQPLR